MSLRKVPVNHPNHVPAVHALDQILNLGIQTLDVSVNMKKNKKKTQERKSFIGNAKEKIDRYKSLTNREKHIAVSSAFGDKKQEDEFAMKYNFLYDALENALDKIESMNDMDVENLDAQTIQKGTGSFIMSMLSQETRMTLREILANIDAN